MLCREGTGESSGLVGPSSDSPRGETLKGREKCDFDSGGGVGGGGDGEAAVLSKAGVVGGVDSIVTIEEGDKKDN